MNLFSSDPGPSYVPAFAGRLLLAMAKGIARAGDPIKRALMDEDVEGMWTLALVVVQWYADNLPATEAQAVAATLQEFGLLAIASNLNLFREQLLPFVRTAHQAQSDAQLAAAGVYFVAAVEQIGLPTLSMAIKAGPVRALQLKIAARLPLPAELKADYYRALGGQPKGTEVLPSASPRPSRADRADRFDRADFSPRPGLTPLQAPPEKRQAQARTQSQPSSMPALAPPPRPPTPVLAQADVTRAYLYTLGWDGAEVDRFLEGPDSKKRT